MAADLSRVDPPLSAWQLGLAAADPCEPSVAEAGTGSMLMCEEKQPLRSAGEDACGNVGAEAAEASVSSCPDSTRLLSSWSSSGPALSWSTLVWTCCLLSLSPPSLCFHRCFLLFVTLCVFKVLLFLYEVPQKSTCGLSTKV